MWNLPRHTYEEIREVVVDILLKPLPDSLTHYSPNQRPSFVVSVGIVFAQREGRREEQRLHPHDAELMRDVFWDLFRQGFITLGVNDSNPIWPWFRLGHFGQQTLQTASPYRFHDTGSFLALVRKEVSDVSTEAVSYLDEAVAAFTLDACLRQCVMLGVAAECEFLRLIDVAIANITHGDAFKPIQRLRFIRQKITKFESTLKPLIPTLPHDAVEDLEANFNMIQSVLRIARNDAGHPTAAAPRREQVYVYLQLFVPFARQLMRLRNELT
jgi:hypothetical protein